MSDERHQAPLQGIPGFSSASLIMGILGDAKSLQASFIIAPIYLLLVVVLLSAEKITFGEKSLRP